MQQMYLGQITSQLHIWLSKKPIFTIGNKISFDMRFSSSIGPNYMKQKNKKTNPSMLATQGHVSTIF